MITEYVDWCLICGKPREAEHHLIRGPLRMLADEDGLKIPMCNDHHNMGKIDSRIHDNIMAEKLSPIIGQLAYEKRKCAEGMTEDEAREDFRGRYKRSYL